MDWKALTCAALIACSIAGCVAVHLRVAYVDPLQGHDKGEPRWLRLS